MTYSLHEDLVEEYQDCQADLGEAKFDHAPDAKIAELQAKCRQYKEKIDLANRCRGVIEEELFKDRSALTRDPRRSDSTPYIAIASLERWAESNPEIKKLKQLAGIRCESHPSAASKPEKTGPHWTPDPRDPEAKCEWYTPARYFARHLVIDDPALLSKRDQLAKKVVQSLTAVGIFKRGGKEAFCTGTVKKAFVKLVFK